MPDRRPYFLTVAGPTGSGKGSLPGKVQKYLRLSKTNTKKLIIDDLVEKSPRYSQLITELLSGMTEKEKRDVFANPSDEMLAELTNAYFTARSQANCDETDENYGKQVSRGDPTTCESLTDNGMTQAFQEGKNIVFETVGKNWPGFQDWIYGTYGSDIKKHQYRVIMAWSIADICTILDRNHSRIRPKVDAFLNKTSTKPPRLPDLRINSVESDYKAIIEYFDTALDKAVQMCKDAGLKVQLLVFDNNTGVKSKVIFDSMVQNKSAGLRAIRRYHVERLRECAKTHSPVSPSPVKRSSARSKTKKKKTRRTKPQTKRVRGHTRSLRIQASRKRSTRKFRTQ